MPSVPETKIDLAFADGEYTFALPLARIREIETKCGAGIGAVFARCLKGCLQVEDTVFIQPSEAAFFVTDIIEVLRQGLIGGGKGKVNGEHVVVTPIVANRLIDSYVLERPLAESWNHAVSVLGACVVGYTPPKKD